MEKEKCIVLTSLLIARKRGVFTRGKAIFNDDRRGGVKVQVLYRVGCRAN